MEIRQLNEPYVVEMGERDGELVQITVRAVEGGKLGYEEIREATRQILEFARRQFAPTPTRMQVQRVRPSTVMEPLLKAYEAGKGRVTDEYLARLAVAYEELAPSGRDVSLRLSRLLDKPVPTIKGHIMRARREGYLTEAIDGKEGGEATDKAREVIANT